MAYWFAIKSRKGKLSNYACSNCFAAAKTNDNGISQISDKCPRCGQEMYNIGLIPEVKYERV